MTYIKYGKYYQKCDEFLKDKKYLESWKRKRPSINCGSGKKNL